MGRRKIEIKKIDDKDKRMVTFSKRRQGLFKKAAAVCRRVSDCNIAVIVFSPAGKSFTFAHPSADAVIDRFLLAGTTGREDEKEINNNNNVDGDHHKKMGVGDGDGDGFWWDNIDMEELDSIEKLQNMKNAVLGLRQNVVKRIDKLASSSSSSASASTAAAIAATITTTTTVEDPSLFVTEDYDICCPSDDEIKRFYGTIDELWQQRPPRTDHQWDLPFSEDEPAELVKSFKKNNDEMLQDLPPRTDHQWDLPFSEDEPAELVKSFNKNNDEMRQDLPPFTDHQADILPRLSYQQLLMD